MLPKYNLITTALKTEKIKYDKFYLGDWCIKYINNNTRLDVNKLPYHWNDKKKLIKDYKYLKNLHPIILDSIFKKLNKELGVNYKKIFWEIYLGPWLNYYLQVMFDRWEIIDSFLKIHGDNFLTDKFDYEENDFICKNLEEFIYNLYSDEYNHIIFNEILAYRLNTKNIFFKNGIKIKPLKKKKYKIGKNIKILRTFEKIFSSIIKKQNFLLFDTYLSRYEETLLNLKLKQIPTIHSPNLSFENWNIDRKLRREVFKHENKSNRFEDFLLKKLNLFIPSEFLENFSNLKNQSNKLYWPKNPKIIFTSHALNNYSLSKFYIAEKVNHGCKLIHGQHGGVYGLDEFTTHEDYELNVSNYFISWGWSHKKKIKPIGILKPIRNISRKNNFKNNDKDKLLYVLGSRSRYSVNLLHSDIRSSQMINYYNENINLISNVDDKIQKKIILRLHSRKYGWDEKKRFTDSFNAIKIDEGYKKISDLIKKSRLVIYTYNGTGFLETLAANVPTIIYFNSKNNLIRNDAKEIFKELQKNKIYFSDAKEASDHINHILNNIDLWWNDQKTQGSRKLFCTKYAKMNDNKLNDIKNLIIDTIDEK